MVGGCSVIADSGLPVSIPPPRGKRAPQRNVKTMNETKLQIEIENPGGCKRVIRATAPAELVSSKLSESFRDINKQVQFPGFRKGKAPRQLLEKRYGQDVANDVRQNLADQAVRSAVEDHGLKLLGQPELIEGGDLKGGEEARLVIEAEVHPEFELPEYKGLELKRETPAIDEAEVYAVMRSEQMQRGEIKAVEGTAEKGRLVRATIKVVSGDETLLPERRGMLEVGQPHVAGLKPREGEEALIGAKVGDKLSLTAEIPEDFAREEFRGKEANIEVEVNEVSEYEGPGLEEVAKQRGYEDLDAWREDVRAKLLSGKEHDQDRAVEERALQQVADSTEMELPQKFSERRAKELTQQQAFRMYQAGMPDEDIQQFLESNKDKGVDEVKSMLKRAFVIDAIARKERVVVTEDEIRREVEAMAERAQRPVEEVLEHLRQNDTLSGMREEMKTGKVLKLLRDKAKYV